MMMMMMLMMLLLMMLASTPTTAATPLLLMPLRPSAGRLCAPPLHRLPARLDIAAASSRRPA
jgi:hypothetical protein